MWIKKWSFSKSTEKINSDVLLPCIHIYLQTPRLHRQKNSKTQGGGAGEGTASQSNDIISLCVGCQTKKQKQCSQFWSCLLFSRNIVEEYLRWDRVINTRVSAHHSLFTLAAIPCFTWQHCNRQDSDFKKRTSDIWRRGCNVKKKAQYNIKICKVHSPQAELFSWICIIMSTICLQTKLFKFCNCCPPYYACALWCMA